MYIVFENVKKEDVKSIIYGVYSDLKEAKDRAKFIFNERYHIFIYDIYDDCLFNESRKQAIYYQEFYSNIEFNG